MTTVTDKTLLVVSALFNLRTFFIRSERLDEGRTFDLVTAAISLVLIVYQFIYSANTNLLAAIGIFVSILSVIYYSRKDTKETNEAMYIEIANLIVSITLALVV